MRMGTPLPKLPVSPSLAPQAGQRLKSHLPTVAAQQAKRSSSFWHALNAIMLRQPGYLVASQDAHWLCNASTMRQRPSSDNSHNCHIQEILKCKRAAMMQRHMAPASLSLLTKCRLFRGCSCGPTTSSMHCSPPLIPLDGPPHDSLKVVHQ